MSPRLLAAWTDSSLAVSPFAFSVDSNVGTRSKWSSSARLLRPVIIRMSLRPTFTASSTTYWIAGLSTTGSISLGIAFVAGRNLVPRPAAGMTALVTRWLMAAPLRSLCADRVRCHPPAIAAAGLRGVQRVVGSTDDRCRCVPVGREDGDTGGECDLQL